MNKLKSVFVAVYIAAMVVITVMASIGLVRGGAMVGYLGALLTSVPFLVMFSAVSIFKATPRTSANLPVITALAVLGMATGVYEYVGASQATQPLVLALTGAAAFFAYNFWYSTLDRTPSPVLVVGAPLPDFSLQDTMGNPVQSAVFREKPTILLFYRGNWCPLCMAQIREIAGEYQRISELGADIALISPQPHENSAKLATQFDVPFKFLVDHRNAAAHELGIEMKDGVPLGLRGYDSDTVFPTVVITDMDGTIIFVDQTDNYRVRPEPKTFIRALEQAGAASAPSA